MFGIVNDNVLFKDCIVTDHIPKVIYSTFDISFDLQLFWYGFLALFILNCFICLEVKRIRQYIKKRGEK
jgi:hypothetical protein